MRPAAAIHFSFVYHHLHLLDHPLIYVKQHNQFYCILKVGSKIAVKDWYLNWDPNIACR
jgi:hypothetical protein